MKQPPAFLNDLYRDMRDRRLLLPALALLVAILAVPIALSASSSPKPTVPAQAVDEDALAVVPAVLVGDDAGIRDYRERLDGLDEKDPFSDKFAPDPASAAGDLAPPDVPVDAQSGGGTSPVRDAPPATGSGPDPSSPSTQPPSSSSPSPSPSPPVEPTIQILEARVDAYVGKAGKRKLQEDIEPGDRLPDRQAPLLLFLGSSSNLEYAEFVVSRDVTGTSGEGQCSGRGKTCEFLRLGEGDVQFFRYGRDSERYAIRVTDISGVVVDERSPGGR